MEVVCRLWLKGEARSMRPVAWSLYGERYELWGTPLFKHPRRQCHEVPQCPDGLLRRRPIAQCSMLGVVRQIRVSHEVCRYR